MTRTNREVYQLFCAALLWLQGHRSHQSHQAVPLRLQSFWAGLAFAACNLELADTEWPVVQKGTEMSGLDSTPTLAGECVGMLQPALWKQCAVGGGEAAASGWPAL